MALLDVGEPLDEELMPLLLGADEVVNNVVLWGIVTVDNGLEWLDILVFRDEVAEWEDNAL